MGLKKPIKKLEQPEDAYQDLPMEIVDFLYESNLIEREQSMEALEDAIQAWVYADKNKNELQGHRGIGRSFILGIHHLLLQRLRPDINGRLRDCDVWIGSQYKPFISTSLLKEQIEQWVDDTRIKPAHKKLSLEKREELAKKWHIAFEDIHGFEDGNGRTGRILWQLQRHLLGLPTLVLNAFEKHEQYYPWFQK